MLSTFANNVQNRPETPRDRLSTAGLWALQLGLAMAFVAFGAAKLVGALPMLQLFGAIGVGQWLRYLTGSLEMLGALLLLAPARAGVGAMLLAGVMTGAVLVNLMVLHTSPLPPLILLAGAMVVAYVRRLEIGTRLWGTSSTLE